MPHYTGFTPACAGRIQISPAPTTGTEVHPRMCGADEYPPRQTATRMGSPPHVRGGSAHSPDKRFYRRFTPACAGRMEDACNAFFGIWVHPRVCGADFFLTSPKFSGQGSPPHVRGGSVWGSLGQLGQGFTPACAGRVEPITSQSLYNRLHP